MVIREGHNFVEIIATDRVAENLPRPGDTRLAVKACSGGFSGESTAWVDAAALASFVEQLQALEQGRQGSAQIESMSPGEFVLSIWSVDRRGHLAVGGRVLRHIHGHDAGPYPHVVEFSFEFDPSFLPSVVAAFQAIAQGHT